MIGLDHQDNAVDTRLVRLADVLVGYPVNDLPCSVALDAFYDPSTDQRRDVRLINVNDRDRHSRVALEIAGLSRTGTGQNYEIVALECIQTGTLCGAPSGISVAM
jgi:hypothetical protein